MIMWTSEDKSLVVPVTDMGTYGLHIFLHGVFNTKPSIDYPELMGADWLYTNSDFKRCIFIKKLLTILISTIEKSPNIRNKTLFLNPKRLILQVHEVEIASLDNLQKERIKLPCRPSHIRFQIKPYIKRLSEMHSFIISCIDKKSGFEINSDNAIDKELSLTT